MGQAEARSVHVENVQTLVIRTTVGERRHHGAERRLELQSPVGC
jgi:hypothetical protein